MKPAERPGLASTNAGWLRQVSRALSLLIVVVLLALLFRGGRAVLAEGERMALGMAEKHLENLVWLEAKRAIGEEGIESLRRRAGQDPRAWARDRIALARPGDAPAGPLPDWADERWSFDPRSGELRYSTTWIEGGEVRWRVMLVEEGADGPTPGQPRDLVLVRVAGTVSRP